jgi:hypothetical protein
MQQFIEGIEILVFFTVNSFLPGTDFDVCGQKAPIKT